MIVLFVVLCFAFPAMETSNVNLGGRCTQDSDCQIAYSACQRGICTCRPSFKAVGGLCTSANFCPYTDNMTPQQRTSVKHCIITGYDTNDMEHVGNCSKGFHCFSHPGTYTPSYQRLGVCCPKGERSNTNFRMVCPQGAIAIKDAKCPDNTRIIADQDPEPNSDTCTSESRQCVYRKKKHVCCEKPCYDSMINIGGRCYSYVLLGENCDHDAQCPGNGKCLIAKRKNRKTCQCPSGAQDEMCI